MNMRENENTSQCSAPDDERIVWSGNGTPFDITGFRTPEKFKNHEADASRVDSLSICPDVEETCRIFSNGQPFGSENAGISTRKSPVL